MASDGSHEHEMSPDLPRFKECKQCFYPIKIFCFWFFFLKQDKKYGSNNKAGERKRTGNKETRQETSRTSRE